MKILTEEQLLTAYAARAPIPDGILEGCKDVAEAQARETLKEAGAKLKGVLESGSPETMTALEILAGIWQRGEMPEVRT